MEDLEERKTEARALMDRIASNMVLCYKRIRKKATLLFWHELVGLASMYAIAFENNVNCKANPGKTIALSELLDACDKDEALLSNVLDYIRK